MPRTCSLPGTGLKDSVENLTESQAGPWRCGRWSRGRCQLAGADGGSGSRQQWADAVFMTFSSSSSAFCSKILFFFNPASNLFSHY